MGRVRTLVATSAFALAALFVLGSASASRGGQGDDAGAPDAGTLPGCVSVGTDSRYVPYGYNHIVIVKNGCSKNAVCSVATDVNPKPVTSEVASGKTVEVLTFSGSPSQTFTARVSCTLR